MSHSGSYICWNPPSIVNRRPQLIPSISVTKTATPSEYYFEDQEIIYTFTVQNTGNTVLGPITITDPLIGPIPSIPGPLNPGVSIGVTASYSTTGTGSDISNTVTVTDSSSGVTGEASATITFEIPVLAVTKTANPTSYSFVGEIITYTYVITNTGAATLLGPFDFVDSLISGITGLTGPLLPGATAGVTASYGVTVSGPDIMNTVTVTDNPSGLTAGATATVPFVEFIVPLFSGTGTSPVPPLAQTFDYYLVGGGGAGGAGNDNLQRGGGGGGGRGKLISSLGNSLIGITGINYTVGAGGIGVLQSDGGTGGNSYITYGLMGATALGGEGGKTPLGIGETGGTGGNDGGGGGGGGSTILALGDGGQGGVAGDASPGGNGEPGVTGTCGFGGTGGNGTSIAIPSLFTGSPGTGGLGGTGDPTGGGGGGGAGGAGATGVSAQDAPSVKNGRGGKGYGAGGGGGGAAAAAPFRRGGDGASGIIVLVFH